MTERRLERSRTDRMVGGVAGGLGEYLGVDPTLVRLAFALAALASGGGALIAYGVLWLFLPEEGTGAVEWKRVSGEETAAAAGRPSDEPPPELASQAQTMPPPTDPHVTPPRVGRNDVTRRRGGSTVVFGGLLVVVGVALIAVRLSSWDVWRLWPLGVVFVGVLVLLSSFFRRD